MIEQFAKLIPPELEDCSGSVFYSGRDAFSGLKDLYILGLNPGGDPDKQRNETIRRHTDGVLHKKPDRWSEYSCERWLVNGAYRQPGEGGIQPSIIHLLQRLGYDPQDIPASNVGFVRSVDAAELKMWCKRNGMTLNQIFNACWPLHREVISYIKPRLILCMGRDAQRILQKKTKAYTIVSSLTKECWRGYLVNVYQNERGCRIVSVTHPSRGIQWTKEKLDPSDVVGQALEGAAVRWSSTDVY